ncbi:MAG: enoyl-CoA hydratase/isomerase family protein [Chloroflexi bacterium]|nr:enoyl-CoA hydratase/isomerase family protein [Chloroflexota bacterium]
MPYENLIYEKQDRIATVTLNRPEYLNAFSPGMGTDIANVFDEIAGDDEVLVTILTGAGRGFSAGAFVRDPNTHAVNSAGEGLRGRAGRGSFPWEHPKPIIAAVNGPAYGAGLNLVLSCDIILAAPEARFCFPMARLGILPAWPGAPALALYVGKAKAAEMTLMARPVDGEDAYRWGLANKCVPLSELMDEARAWAQEIAALAPLSTKLIKDDLRESFEGHFNRSANRLRFMALGMTEDREEGHRAWREKRAPVFKGR